MIYFNKFMFKIDVRQNQDLQYLFATQNERYKTMITWDGNVKDTTNFTTDKYLQINSCGFQCTPLPNTVIRKKGRKDYHILLIDSGECELLHNDKLYILSRGNLAIYAPNEEQKYSFSSGCSSLWCHFSGNLVEELFNSSNLSSGVYFLNPNKEIFESYSTLIQRFHLSDKQLLANASLLELIYHISNASTASEQNRNSDIITQTLTYININYNKQLTLDELAKKAGYSKSRFSHLFLEIVGMSPIKYQNDIRLKNSCELLHSTKLTIAEIAQSCGFNDPLYFSRIFKKKYKISPTQYRLSN